MSAAPLLIVGFHRSGTSLCAQWLHEAGLAVGTHLLPPTAHNPHGYFEDEEVVRFHDGQLAALGHAWFMPGGPLALHDPEAMAWIGRYALHRTASVGPGRAWGVKDPRLCLTIRLWMAALPRLDVLYVHRDPFECATSVWERAWDQTKPPQEPEAPVLARDKGLVADLYAHSVSSVLSAHAARRPDDRWAFVAHDDLVAGRVDAVAVVRERFGIALEPVPVGAVLDRSIASRPRRALSFDPARTVRLASLDQAFRALVLDQVPEDAQELPEWDAETLRRAVLTYALAVSERRERTARRRLHAARSALDTRHQALDAMQGRLDAIYLARGGRDGVEAPA